MKIKDTFLVTSIAVLSSVLACSFLTCFFLKSPNEKLPLQEDRAFQHVLNRKELRCAYGLAGRPRFVFDNKTGKPIRGVQYDIMEAIAALLHIKVTWDEVAGYGSFPENLHGHRQDMFCSTVWESPARSHRVLLTRPLYFTPLYVLVRADDKRFDRQDYAALNRADITFSLVDGTTPEEIAKQTFPKAKLHRHPLGGDVSQPLLDVAQGKADAAIFNLDKLVFYNKNNPEHKLKAVKGLAPVRIYGESFALDIQEWKLREMINSAILELIQSGTLAQILQKYHDDFGGAYYLPALPYKASKEETLL